MPYTIVERDNMYCVHKRNEDNSVGKQIACHDTKQKAIAQIGAIESAEKMLVEKKLDELSAIQSDILSHLVWALLWEERYEDAYQVIGTIQEEYAKIRSLISLASYLPKESSDLMRQYFREAESLIRELDDKTSQAYMLANLASAMADRKFIDEALEIAYSITDLNTMQKEYLALNLKARSKAYVQKNNSYVTFKQDSNGDWWFIGLYSNKFKDRQEEILSEDAHKDYVEWVKESGIKPQITLFHMPRAEKGFWYQVMTAYEKGMIRTETMNTMLRDFYKEYALAETEKVFYVNGFVGVAAKVYKDRESWINNLVNYKDILGMSHGFIPRELNDNIYTKYRSFEMSILPKSRAANVWTEVLFMEGTMPFNKEDQEFLDGIKEGTSDELDRATESTRQKLEDDGVEFKESDVQEEEQKETPEETPESLVNDLVKQMVAYMKWDEFGNALHQRLTEINSRFDEIEARIKEVEKTEDEKIASQYQPPWQHLIPQMKEQADKEQTPKVEEKAFDFLGALLTQNQH